MNRIVITGIGLVTPLGNEWATFAQNTLNGISGIRETTFELEGFPDLTLPVAAVLDFDAQRDLPKCKTQAWDRLSHFGLFAARSALKDAGIEGREVDALIVGSSTTSVETLDDNYWRFLRGSGRVSPMMIPKSMPNAPISAISIDQGIRGISYSVASACSSANQALINAAEQIKFGQAKIALAGGVEASISYSNLNAWNQMRVLSHEACRPFCKSRSGLVIGEGSVLFVLEDLDHAQKRGAYIYAELSGWGQSSDAHSITTPKQDCIETAMRSALVSAKLEAKDIDYINAHGTGTQLNDQTESGAVVQVFGTKIPVSSTKSQHGHLLGAAGAIELASSIAAIKAKTIPPTIGWREQDEEIAINVVLNKPQKADIQNILSASYAFGGHNTVLVVSAS